MAVYDEIDPFAYDERFKIHQKELYMHNHWNPIIKNAIEQYCKNKKVLELGCGTGKYTLIIQQQTDDFMALDSSQNMVNYLKNKTGIKNVLCADAHKIPLKEKFDVIIAIGLFEYVNKEIVMREIKRVLKDDGCFIFLSSNKYSGYLIISKLILKILRKNYLRNEPSKNEMLKLFKKNKFDIIEFKMDDGLIWLPNFLDNIIGIRIYLIIEKLFKKIFKQNPFSNNLFFVVTNEMGKI